MTVNETTAVAERAAKIDEQFVRRALDEADLNAVRIALVQATGDESLLDVGLKRISVRGGQLVLVDVADEDRERVKDRAVRFLLEEVDDFVPRAPTDAELRTLMEALRGEPVSDRSFLSRKESLGFEERPRSAEWTHGRPELPEGFEVAIVGAGFNGILMGIQLEWLGIPYRIYERRSELGGTWSVNRYPDVRVDITNFVYQYSFERDYPWEWYYAPGPEIRKYLEFVARKRGVYDRIEFDSDIARADYDEQSCTWTLQVTGPDGATREVTANIVVSASGLFNAPKKLDVPGIDEFRGRVLHTTGMTGDEDFAGRTVAIIGNGSTGVQLLKRVASVAKKVNVHVRTPQWIAARERYTEQLSPETRWLLATLPFYPNWYTYSMLAMQEGSQKLHVVDEEWVAKGGKVNEVNDAFRAALEGYIADQLEGHPELIEKLTPKYAPMARRQVADNQWYKTLLQDHVEPVFGEVVRITPDAVVVADGSEHPADDIITATGFAVSKYLHPTTYRGKGGRTLEDFWDSDPEGPKAYIGMTIPGFPNLFTLYGPNAQPRSGAIVGWFETWTQYIARAIVYMLENGHREIDVKHEVFEEYNEDLKKETQGKVWLDEDALAVNYYVNAAGRLQVGVPWNLEDYYDFFQRTDFPEDYHLR
ncbi:MAG: NAD(P)/FAD-dependent oxidoreductase [Microbacterium sp.]